MSPLSNLFCLKCTSQAVQMSNLIVISVSFFQGPSEPLCSEQYNTNSQEKVFLTVISLVSVQFTDYIALKMSR